MDQRNEQDFDEKASSPSQADAMKSTAVHLEKGQPAPGGHEIEFTGRQFGTVQGYDATGKHILIPQPSDVGKSL